MAMKYILIDYENVQPKDLKLLAKLNFKIFLFVGSKQSKIPVDIAVAMQAISGTYIKISGAGPNALDFHIAYYIGKLSAQEKAAQFYIVSKDKGYAPLIEHLKTLKVIVHRVENLQNILTVQTPIDASRAQKIETILHNLQGRGASKPRKIKTLSNTINSLFTENLSDKELKTLLNTLQQKKYIILNENGGLSYTLPKPTKKKT